MFIINQYEELSIRNIWKFYCNIHLECDFCRFSSEEKEKVFDYYCGFGNISSRFAYYKQAYCRPLYRAIREIFSRSREPRILDVCCGVGTQAILFSLLGASVVGLDYDDAQLQIMRKRIDVYDQYLSSRLDILLHIGDVHTQDFSQFGAFDVIYSHCGVGHLLAADDVFLRVSQCLRPGGLVVLKDGNPQCLWLRAVNRRASCTSRDEYLSSAQNHGFMPLLVRGTTGVPRPLWLLGEATRLPDAVLRRFLPFDMQIEYIFEKL
jgi:SAM-dependent methyltransferase